MKHLKKPNVTSILKIFNRMIFFYGRLFSEHHGGRDDVEKWRELFVGISDEQINHALGMLQSHPDHARYPPKPLEFLRLCKELRVVNAINKKVFRFGKITDRGYFCYVGRYADELNKKPGGEGELIDTLDMLAGFIPNVISIEKKDRLLRHTHEYYGKFKRADFGENTERLRKCVADRLGE